MGRPGSYDSQDSQGFGSELSLDDIRFAGRFDFSNLPDELTEVGQMKTEEYNLLVDAVLHAGEATLNMNNVIATLQQKFTLTSIDDREQVFDTELLWLDLDLPFLRGLPFDIQFALDPTRAFQGPAGIDRLGGEWHHRDQLLSTCSPKRASISTATGLRRQNADRRGQPLHPGCVLAGPYSRE